MSVQINKIYQFLYFTILLSVAIAAVFTTSSLHNKNETLSEVTTENLLLQSKYDHLAVQYDSLSRSIEMSPLDDPDLAPEIKESVTDLTLVDVHGSPKTRQAIQNKITYLKSEIAKNSEQLLEIQSKSKANHTDLNNLLELNASKKIESRDLTVANVSTRGVRIFTNMSSKNKENKIQQLRVCFSIDENEFTPQGNKKIYIQVVNPRNQIITKDTYFLEKEGIKLKYSTVVNADFKNLDLDLCSYVDLEPEKVYKGKYLINIYHNFKKISSTYFEYE